MFAASQSCWLAVWQLVFAGKSHGNATPRAYHNICQFANRLGGRAWKYFYKLKHEEAEAQANGSDQKLKFNPFLQNIFLLILVQSFMLSLLQTRDSNQYLRRQEKKVFSSLNQLFSAGSSRSCAEGETYWFSPSFCVTPSALTPEAFCSQVKLHIAAITRLRRRWETRT